jgi:hypothetical protein
VLEREAEPTHLVKMPSEAIEHVNVQTTIPHHQRKALVPGRAQHVQSRAQRPPSLDAYALIFVTVRRGEMTPTTHARLTRRWRGGRVRCQILRDGKDVTAQPAAWPTRLRHPKPARSRPTPVDVSALTVQGRDRLCQDLVVPVAGDKPRMVHHLLSELLHHLPTDGCHQQIHTRHQRRLTRSSRI